MVRQTDGRRGVRLKIEAARRGAVVVALFVIATAVPALWRADVSAGSRRGEAAHPVAQSDTLMGDVNCGSTVDTVDSLQILRLVAGLSTNADCMEPAGDVDCDGDNDSVDSLRILRHVAGLSNTTPQGCTPIGDSLEPPPSSF